MNIKKIYPYILAVCSIVGLFASFALTVDTIKFIENPDANFVCNLNPFVSCGSIFETWQSQVFGFPNSLIGIVAFSMLFAVALMLFFGGSNSSLLDKISGESKARKPFWILVNVGTLLAMIFVIWFFYESVFEIGRLCLYCMTVWTITWPIFLYTTIWNFKEGRFSTSISGKIFKNKQRKFFESLLNFISDKHLLILISFYILLSILILIQFRGFFFAS